MRICICTGDKGPRIIAYLREKSSSLEPVMIEDITDMLSAIQSNGFAYQKYVITGHSLDKYQGSNLETIFATMGELFSRVSPNCEVVMLNVGAKGIDYSKLFFQYMSGYPKVRFEPIVELSMKEFESIVVGRISYAGKPVVQKGISTSVPIIDPHPVVDAQQILASDIVASPAPLPKASNGVIGGTQMDIPVFTTLRPEAASSVLMAQNSTPESTEAKVAPAQTEADLQDFDFNDFDVPGTNDEDEPVVEGTPQQPVVVLPVDAKFEPQPEAIVEQPNSFEFEVETEVAAEVYIQSNTAGGIADVTPNGDAIRESEEKPTDAATEVAPVKAKPAANSKLFGIFKGKAGNPAGVKNTAKNTAQTKSNSKSQSPSIPAGGNNPTAKSTAPKEGQPGTGIGMVKPKGRFKIPQDKLIEMNRRPRMVVVTGNPRAGTSCTTANLAHVAQACGLNTIVLDLDFYGRGMCFYFPHNINPEETYYTCSISNAIRSPYSFNDFLWEITGNLSILGMALSVSDVKMHVDALSSEKLGDLLAVLRTTYDLVLLDMPFEYVSKYNSAILQTDNVAYVTENDLQSLYGIINRVAPESFRDATAYQTFRRKCGFVVNKYNEYASLSENKIEPSNVTLFLDSFVDNREYFKYPVYGTVADVPNACQQVDGGYLMADTEGFDRIYFDMLYCMYK